MRIVRIAYPVMFFLIGLIVGSMLERFVKTDTVDPRYPTDYTGKTSIVVFIDGIPDSEAWVELRGPARFEALELFGPRVPE